MAADGGMGCAESAVPIGVQDARRPVCPMHNLFIYNQLAVENGL